MTKEKLPLTATVVIERVKRGGQFHGHRVLEMDRFYVRSEPGGRWQACRHGSIDAPVRVTGEVAIVLPLAKAHQKTPEDAAYLMWKYIREIASVSDTWLVDEDLPDNLRAGVNLMSTEQAMAIHDAIVMTRTPTVDAASFLAQHEHFTAGRVRPDSFVSAATILPATSAPPAADPQT